MNSDKHTDNEDASSKPLAYGLSNSTAKLPQYRSNYSDFRDNQIDADFTLLVYMVGSDLEDNSYEATKDLKEMLVANNLSSKVNVILQTGGANGKIDSTRFIDFSTTKRFKIMNNTVHPLPDPAQENMGENKTLSEFITWSVTNYPAKKYGLILWDHGASVGGFGKDVNHNNDVLYLHELRDAIFYAIMELKGFSFEFIGFDSCLMGSIEVATLLSSIYPMSRYLIGSEEIEPNWGWNYTTVINSISNSSDIRGDILGKHIINSYIEDSGRISQRESIHADRDITLSVVDLGKISLLNEGIDRLVNATIKEIKDKQSLFRLLRTVDLTEHYGQDATRSYGIVDLYDFATNLEKSYPSLKESVSLVKDLLNDTIIYQYSGKSHPNSNGLSFYLPLSYKEFSLIYNEFGNKKIPVFPYNINWFRLINILYLMSNGDEFSPIITSDQNGESITMHIFGQDIEKIFMHMVVKSNKGNYLQYIQNLDPNDIDESGYFTYNNKENVLVLCDDRICIPVSMIMDVSTSVKKIFIPVEIESANGVVKRVSLSYEFVNGDFVFLGGLRKLDIRGGEPLPKEKISLEKGDKIFSQGITFDKKPYYILNSKTIKERIDTNFQTFERDNHLVVSNPEEITPRYVDINRSSIWFSFCDFAANCESTRTYDIVKTDSRNVDSLLTNKTQSQVLELPLDVKQAPISSTKGLDRNYLYVNQEYDFQLGYPNDWFVKSVDIYDEEILNSTFQDPQIALLYPRNEFVNNTSPFKTSLSLAVHDSEVFDDPKALFNFFNNSRVQRSLQGTMEYKILDNNVTTVNGYPAFEFLFENQNKAESVFEVDKQRLTYLITIVMHKREYTLSYDAYEDIFPTYLSEVKQIVETFRPAENSLENEKVTGYRVIDENGIVRNNTYLAEKKLVDSVTLKNYSDTQFGFKMVYPYVDNTNDPQFDIIEQVHTRGFVLPDMILSFDNPFTQPVVTMTIIDGRNFLNNKDMIQTSLYSGRLDRLSQLPFFPLFDRSILPVYQLLNSSLIEIPSTGKSIATEETYFMPKFQLQLMEKVVYTILDDKLLVISLMAIPDKYDNYERVFDSMIYSIRS